MVGRFIYILAFFFSWTNAWAEEGCFRLDGQAEPSTYVYGCVNAITGSFIYSCPDIVVEGPEPLSFMRHYCSNNNLDRNFGKGFSHNHATNTTPLREEDVIYNSIQIEESGGDRLYFTALHQKGDLKFYLNPVQLRRGYTNCTGGQISGRTNIKNTTIVVAAGDKLIGRCKVTLGDGTKRQYNKNCLLTEEVRPSGNVIHYLYDKSERIKRIYSTDASGGTTFCWMDFTYDKNRSVSVVASNGLEGKYELKKRFDKKEITYTLTACSITGKPACSFDYVTTYRDDEENRVLDSIHWEGGKFVELDYRQNKVRAIYLPGEDGSRSKIYDIAYHPNSKYTVVTDLYNGKSIYSYSKKLRLEKKERYNDGSLYSMDQFFWGGHHKNGSPGKPLKDDEGYLLTKGIANAKNEVLSVTTYSYDTYGNVLSETIAGDLTGNGEQKPIRILDKKPVLDGREVYTRHYTYSKDGRNLITSIGEDDGSLTVIQYLPGTDKISSKLTYAEFRIVSREFYTYNHLGILTKQISDDGKSEKPGILDGVTQRTITTIHPNLAVGSYGFGKPSSVVESFFDPAGGHEKQLRKVDYTYGKFDLVTSESHYDAEGRLRYVLNFSYDATGNCIAQTDPMGRTTQYRYNELQQCIFKELVGSGMSTVYAYDTRGRLIRTTENHSSGESFLMETRYDQLDRKVAEIDTFGNQTSFEYDDMGRLIKITYPPIRNENGALCAPVETKSYNIFDQVILETDPLGNQTSKKYTTRGQLKEVRYPDGTTESYRYCLNGTLQKKVNKDGSFILLTYDLRKRPIREETHSSEGSLLRSKHYQYEGDHLAFETDSMGNVTEYQYDGAGRKTAQIRHGPERNLRDEYHYDALGRLNLVRTWFGEGAYDYTQLIKEFDLSDRVVEERVEDSTGRVYSRTEFRYDICGNCIEKRVHQDENRVASHHAAYTSYNLPKVVKDPMGNETHFFYDFNFKNGNGQRVLKTIVTDPMGVQTITIHDAHGREACIEKRNGINTRLSYEQLFYDSKGQKKVHSADVVSNGKKIREYRILWEYDSLGRPVKVVEDPSGKNKRTLFSYTSLGGLKTKTKPDGVVVSHDYDPMGREISVASSDGSVSYSFAYDLNDHLIESVDHLNGFNLARQYDCFGNMIGEEFQRGICLGMRYDCLQRMTQLTLPDGSRVEYDYDPVSMTEVRRVGNENPYIHRYLEKDLVGRSLKTALITGDETHFEWDVMGRPVRISTPYLSEMIPPGGYDSVGNLLHVDYTGALGALKENYRYDDLNHLTSEKGVEEHTYLNDSLDNRLEKDKSRYDLNTLNQVEHDGETRYRYDPNGNLASREDNGEVSYEYDALDRLVWAVKAGEWKVHYGYDSFGRCLQRRKFRWEGAWIEEETRQFLFLGLHDIGSLDSQGKIQELRILGQAEGSASRPAVAIELEGVAFAPLYDHRHNLIALVDLVTKAPSELYRYSAYGDAAIYSGNGLLRSSSKTRNPWLFGSKRYDPATGLYNFGKRYYSPALGRWITPDPGEFVDGLNLYAYTRNRPLVCTDFYGFQTMPVFPVYGGLAHGFSDESFSNLGSFIEGASHHAIPTSEFQYAGEGLGRLLQGKTYTHEYSGNMGIVSGVVGDKSMGNIRSRITTGIMTSVGDAERAASYFSSLLGGGEVYYTCHQSRGFVSDMLRVSLEMFGYGKSFLKELERDVITDHLEMREQYGDNYSLHLIPHSRGSLEANVVLPDLGVDNKNKMNIYGLGGARPISKGDYNIALNYENGWDAIPKIGRAAALFAGMISSPQQTINDYFYDKPQVVYIDSASKSWLPFIEDHYIDSPGYQEALRDISQMIMDKSKRK